MARPFRLAAPAAALVLAPLPFAAAQDDLVVSGGAVVVNDGGAESYDEGFVGFDPTGAAPNPGDSGTYRALNGGTAAFDVRVRVGEAGGGRGTLEIFGDGSEVTTDGGFVLENGAMTVADGGTARGGVFVGNAADAELSVESGGTFESPGSVVGVGAGVRGGLTVIGEGAVFNASSTVSIGGLGTGRADVLSGGRLAADILVVGDQAGSSGRVALEGAGSAVETAGSLAVGANGDGGFRAEAGTVTVGGTCWSACSTAAAAPWRCGATPPPRSPGR